ncbi:hypothetical protein DI09_83p110 [Mitosporidium daphniae]|uniref:Letm1 RBD domain-containing protein n=1 Tax=Mitosporidium daphniae TaxID=1485682 RepID=A0A098VM80_9MICR|nr:uncharacterized protein DI09_83p110 [Mitosporidium daphniae]KGG50178.1 hypothetical protein DI09_83p110 [Mitosporidium daphniae]|eukprot:XP_013236605.1 uncharacterized protein DI09_83p110 [Mitosporidium daphniae]
MFSSSLGRWPAHLYRRPDMHFYNLNLYSSSRSTPPNSDPPAPTTPIKPSVWTRIKSEVEHYKQGSVKFGKETKSSFKLLFRVYKAGTIDSLTRRERIQLARTGADMLRLVPFSIFVIVPLLEFLLPFFIKVFPNMLPSTFENQEARKTRLETISRARKAAHDALHLVLLEVSTSDKQPNIPAKKLAEILQESNINASTQPLKERMAELTSLLKSNQISQYGFTPESISGQHLHAICSLLGLGPIRADKPRPLPLAKITNSKLVFLGTDALRRYQLRNHLKEVKKDDKLISAEGVDSLLPAELVHACHMRGIPTFNQDPSKTEEEHSNTLKADLQQWLDLTGHYGFPMILVILSNALLKK